jgi:predicted nucleotidyltransferase
MDKILKYFINEPEREFHVRELAKIIKKSPTTISKYLTQMEKENLLLSRREFGHLLFRANNESQDFKDKKLFYNINLIRRSGLINHLESELNYPKAIVLFGSFAKAENIPSSDIDLMIVTSSKKELNLIKFENKIGHSIQLFLVNPSKIEQMKKSNPQLLNNFINGFILSGYLEVFK